MVRESCGINRKVGFEALTAVRAGRVLSREIPSPVSGADDVPLVGRQHFLLRDREEQRDPARSETSSTYASTLRGNRETLRLALMRVRVKNPEGAM